MLRLRHHIWLTNITDRSSIINWAIPSCTRAQKQPALHIRHLSLHKYLYVPKIMHDGFIKQIFRVNFFP